MTRWRDARRCAEHLDISEARFIALVKSGKFPKASYHLGTRSPRWDIAALDAAMAPAGGSRQTTRAAFDDLARRITEGQPGRKVRRNHGVS